MMFIDASAFVTVLVNERRAADILEVLRTSFPKVTSGIARLETCIALTRILGIDAAQADALFDRFLAATDTIVVPFTDAMARRAVAARERFGKGRHPARLNLADCLAYGAATELGVPLLFVGDDFSRTDVVGALADPRP